MGELLMLDEMTIRMRTAHIAFNGYKQFRLQDNLLAGGYLLARAPGNADAYEIVALSLIGRKTIVKDCEKSLQDGETIWLQRPGRTLSGFSKHDFCQATLNKRNTTLLRAEARPVPGSMFVQGLLLLGDCRPAELSGNASDFYLVGADLAQARQRFAGFLARVQVPCHESWHDVVWNAMWHEGWITELLGLNMGGYHIAYEQSELMNLVSALFLADRFNLDFVANAAGQLTLPAVAA